MIAARTVAVALALLAVATALEAAALFDPVLRFRRLATDHFVIYFHQGEDRLAARLAVIAEETRAVLARSFGVPAARTHVVLADQNELANGWATPVPYNTIVIHAAWPAGADLTGQTDDWLRSVFVHEFTHIAHLDRSGDWARLVRGVFGRLPLAFPNLFVPAWEMEGIATLQESRLTGGGRLHAADFTAIVRESARRDALEPVDRIGGGLTDWPAGQGPYAYGLGFHEYLFERFGEEALGALADFSARTIPYAGSFAFEDAFGVPFRTLWRDYTATLTAGASGDDDGAHDGATRLTFHGFTTTGPRFLPPPCAACPAQVAYTTQTPHGFPSIQVIGPDGENGRLLATRYLGATLGATRTLVVFDQQELRRSTGLYSDLYAVDRATGRVSALTREARLLDPDVAPDGRLVVAVQQARGERALVLLDLFGPETGNVRLGTTRTLAAEPDTQFNAPRWSPDGTSIVAERHRLGALPEVVVIDTASRDVRVVGASLAHRVVTPTWHPNGQAIVAAADVDGTFNLVEFPVSGGAPKQLTSVHGGASWPEVAPDGATIVYVGYTIDGFDIFTMPYPRRPGPSRPELAAGGRPASQAPSAPPAPVLADVPAYRPWSTLRPTYWGPIVTVDADQLRAGAFTGGFDVLQYHGFQAEMTWLVDSMGRDPEPRPHLPDWNLRYAYSRWRPTFFASTSQTTSLVHGPVDALGLPLRGSVRERAIEGGLTVPTRSVRASRQWLVALRRESLEFSLAGSRRTATEHAVRAGWSMRTAREYGYSISPEDGVALGTTLDWRPDSRGSAVTTLTVDGRAYLPALGRHHVTAVRAAAGLSAAPLDARRRFLLGGAGASAGTLDFDRDALGLLRGFGDDQFGGSRIAVFNADYRWPLTRPQRGIRTLPFMFHTIHAALFADLAYAWDRDPRPRDGRAAVGGELALDLVAGYRVPLTVAVGAAWTRDGAAAQGAALFGRIGRSF